MSIPKEKNVNIYSWWNKQCKSEWLLFNDNLVIFQEQVTFWWDDDDDDVRFLLDQYAGLDF